MAGISQKPLASRIPFGSQVIAGDGNWHTFASDMAHQLCFSIHCINVCVAGGWQVALRSYVFTWPSDVCCLV